MPEPTSPRAVFERLNRGIAEGRWNDLADLYAEDAVVRQPFAPPASGAPQILEGRETIRARFAGAARMGLRFGVRNVIVHETTDPEVIVAEFDYDIPAGDDVLTAANVQVLRVRDGLIIETRDYHDHLTIARATGGLSALLAALDGETA
ncbi:nuclear transport factor 2 family protein [Actinoallomurus purpureus]|uniref:nuclear transport factor 2 family protein n=1 Tax=Actinoallomurus purpureus TaxID=478114 RepID=UPI0020925F6E|nr:nuclear transport factor 2 family protein [Actinoallomurus purpureus]MCO6010656.1 nuclear transport factor 2 family protein [Actinoallomurus purpureus]